MVQVRVINSFGDMVRVKFGIRVGGLRRFDALRELSFLLLTNRCSASQSNDFDELTPSIKDKGLSKIVLFGCKTIKTKLT